MIVLSLDTALAACSVAVTRDGDVLAALSEPMHRGHQERLAPMVEEAMRAAGLPFTAIDRIGVTVGPGSFTGLRVGLAFAKGLGLALDRPCVGIGTLEALAASDPGPGLTVAVIDARRGQLYLQAFESGDNRMEAARTHVAWGLVSREHGNIAAAQHHFKQAAAQFRTSGLAAELEQIQDFILKS